MLICNYFKNILSMNSIKNVYKFTYNLNKNIKFRKYLNVSYIKICIKYYTMNYVNMQLF